MDYERDIMGYTEKKRTKLFALPICFTTYTITEDKLSIKRGFLTIVEDEAYMYKIQDVRLRKTFLERIFKLSTIICYTGDKTHPELRLEHIKNGEAIKNYIMDESETARRKRRTLHTMDIGTDGIEDIENID